MTVRIPLDTHGDVVGAIAETEHVVIPDPQNDPLTQTLRHDLAPDHQWLDGTDWMRIRTG